MCIEYPRYHLHITSFYINEGEKTTHIWKTIIMQYLEYHTKEEDQGREVISILRSELGLSTTKIRSVKWDPAGILLDGERVTVRHRVEEGQTLRVLKNDSENRQKRILPCPMKLDILYEDEDLIFINKPAGLVCHPSAGHRLDSLANGIQAYFDEKAERSSIHLLGRLDKDTSGIVGIAKNGVIARKMILDRRIKKEYLAIAEGYLPADKGTIELPMEEYRDPEDHLLKMRPGDKIAVTSYEVIHRQDDLSICRVWIATGRMHQIRSHMALIGHPLLGDSIYGHGPTEHMSRAALHAYKVSFAHPVSEEKITIKADFPKDMMLCANCMKH